LNIHRFDTLRNATIPPLFRPIRAIKSAVYTGVISRRSGIATKMGFAVPPADRASINSAQSSLQVYVFTFGRALVAIP
jgi:hypothetical protein